MIEFTIEELNDLLSDSVDIIDVNEKYISWEKFNPEDFASFELLGKLVTKSNSMEEYSTTINYWARDYPIAVNYFPNSGCEIYKSNTSKYYMVYVEFGGHVPEKRCRRLQRDLIVE